MRRLLFGLALMAAAGPALCTQPAPPSKQVAPGTNVFGDDESPLGLDITPWKDDYAQSGMDRPARLLEESPQRVDPDVFHRQIDYYDTISAYRKAAVGGAAQGK